MFKKPIWYHHKYPTFEDLLIYLDDKASVTYADIGEEALFVYGDKEQGIPDVIILPKYTYYLNMCWLLAHEIGHLVSHAGPGGKEFRLKNEAEACAWAAQALIPLDRIRHYNNASPNAFIGALSAHYGPIPYCDCPERFRANEIAKRRLTCLKQKQQVQIKRHIYSCSDRVLVEDYTARLPLDYFER